ncbi:Piso0_000597 [Millerozyma farinosa CBS 7064]|uniref:Piso0_000597 protein n=1 Tax=Pichia sorbitophila (strain ATCC MYA-4447 / BCRC 22081 / CBS 7064 / NBRC 10061 / NRRL Y-12695) TaxID=559304 RepID=G8YST8_PICSO|nr:Piso0_000597 [Millerozyma farinosa CBS 7064]CCE73550.1 Piso0_000597 [Millerozyma farinosa CBS 7064]
MSNEIKHGREPGFFEKYYLCRSAEKYTTNVSVIGRYNKHIDKVVLSNALRSLIVKNPEFCCNFFSDEPYEKIKKQNGKPYRLKPLSKIAFQDVVFYEWIEKDLDDEILDRLDTEYSGININEPLWKLIIFENTASQYLSFSYDHTLWDGKSGQFFHEELLSEIEQFSKSKDITFRDDLFDYEKDQSALPVLPKSSDKMFDLYDIDMWYTLKHIVKEIIPTRITNYLTSNSFSDPYTLIDYPFPKEDIQSSRISTKLRLVHVDASSLNKLVKNCKENGVTLTSYMTTLMTYCLKETVLSNIGKNKVAKISIPMSGRRYYPDKAQETKFGLYVGAINYNIKLDKITEGNMKTLSQSLLNNMRIALETQEPFKFCSLLKLINIWDFLGAKVEKNDRDTVAFSNLGMTNAEKGGWKLIELIFSQSNGIYTNYSMSTISTPEAGLNITFGYSKYLENFIERAAFDSFLSLFKEKLIH